MIIRSNALGLVIMFLFLFQIAFSQTYLTKNIDINSYSCKDSIILNSTLRKAEKWHRFKSKKCISTIDFLHHFQNSFTCNKGSIDTSFIDYLCDFKFDKVNYNTEKHIIRDSLLFNNKIKNKDFFKKNVFSKVDESRYNQANGKSNIELYYNYLFGCDFYLYDELIYKKAAEDSIFSLTVPSLYKQVRHYIKLNELIKFLNEESNYVSSNYPKAFNYLYKIYTNDGELATIKKIVENEEFDKCKQRCDQNFQVNMDSLFKNDIEQAKLYNRINERITCDIDSLELYVKNNLPKESSYRIIQKLNKAYIINENFIKAANIFRKFFNKADSVYLLFPEMREKMQLTINLLEDSRNNRNQRYEIMEKAYIGYGPVDKVFPTNESYYFSIYGNGYNNIATTEKGSNKVKNTIQSEIEKVFDVSFDEKKICVLKTDNTIFEITSEGNHTISSYLHSKKNEDINVIKREIHCNTNISDDLFMIKESDDFLTAKQLDQIEKNKWEQISIDSKGALTDIVYLYSNGEIKPISNIINNRYSEKNAYLTGDTLFFSSNSYYGFGGYDIYMSIKRNDAWSKPVNLGFGINSPFEEMNYRKNKDQSTFICYNKDSLQRLPLTIGKIDETKRVYFLKVGLPKGDANSQISVNYFDKNGEQKEKPIYKSFLEGDTLCVKLSETDGCLVITSMNEKEIYEKQIDLDKVPTLEISCLCDTTIIIPEGFEEISIEDVDSLILNPGCLGKLIEAEILNDYPPIFKLGNNIQRWYIKLTDYSETIKVERIIKLVNTSEEIPENEKGAILTVSANKKSEKSELLLCKEDSVKHVIYYKTNESKISPFKAYEYLNEFVNPTLSFIKGLYNQEASFDNYDGVQFELNYDGYADERGSKEFNNKLSLNRSKCAKHFFTDDNDYSEIVKKSVLHNQVKGWGKTNIWDKDNATKEESWQENRRVIVLILWK